MADDLRQAIAGRNGWQLDDDAAMYAPGGQWSALVRRTTDPRGRGLGPVWHVAFRKGGVVQHTRIASTPEQAVKFAERLPQD
jgi:hypothetical protein